MSWKGMDVIWSDQFELVCWMILENYKYIPTFVKKSCFADIYNIYQIFCIFVFAIYQLINASAETNLWSIIISK